MPDDETLVQLPMPEAGEDEGTWAPVVVEGYSGLCLHLNATVDARARELRCRRCRALVDPIEFLKGWANRLRSQGQDQLELVKGLEQVRVHALGPDDSLTLCGIGSKAGGWERAFTVRVSTERKRIDCRRCLDKLEQGKPALLDEDLS